MSMGSGFGWSRQQSVISPLRVLEEEARCARSSGISESLRLQIWAVHEQMTHDKQEKRPKLGSLALELAGCPDKLFTNCLVAGLPAWVGQQLFFHSYRRNLAQL
jgi:hypothetical protein